MPGEVRPNAQNNLRPCCGAERPFVPGNNLFGHYDARRRARFPCHRGGAPDEHLGACTSPCPRGWGRSAVRKASGYRLMLSSSWSMPLSILPDVKFRSRLLTLFSPVNGPLRYAQSCAAYSAIAVPHRLLSNAADRVRVQGPRLRRRSIAFDSFAAFGSRESASERPHA